MLNNLKVKAKEGKDKVCNFVSDHAFEIGYWSVLVGGTVALCVVGKRKAKEYNTMWRNAMTAFRNGDKDYDYGPYKITEFFEPNTGEKIGELLMHQDSVKAFLDVD